MNPSEADQRHHSTPQSQSSQNHPAGGQGENTPNSTSTDASQNTHAQQHQLPSSAAKDAVKSPTTLHHSSNSTNTTTNDTAAFNTLHQVFTHLLSLYKNYMETWYQCHRKALPAPPQRIASIWHHAAQDTTHSSSSGSSNSTSSGTASVLTQFINSSTARQKKRLKHHQKNASSNNSKPKKKKKKQQQQTIAKWFQSTSYFETQRHLAYLNEQSYSTFQQKFKSTMQSQNGLLRKDEDLFLLLRFLLDGSLYGENSPHQQHLPNQNAPSTNSLFLTPSQLRSIQLLFSSSEEYHKLCNIFLIWLLEELMRRFTVKLKGREQLATLISSHFSSQNSTHSNFTDFFSQTLDLFLASNPLSQEFWRLHYTKHVLILCILSIHRKVSKASVSHLPQDLDLTTGQQQQQDVAKRFHTAAFSFLKSQHTIQQELHLLHPLVNSPNQHGKTLRVMLNKLADIALNRRGTATPQQQQTNGNQTTSIQSNNQDVDLHLVLTLSLLVKLLPPLSSIFLSIILERWSQIASISIFSTLIQCHVTPYELEQEEDEQILIGKNSFLSLLLHNLEFLGEFIFPLLRKLDSIRSELGDVMFLLMVEQMQHAAFENISHSVDSSNLMQNGNQTNSNLSKTSNPHTIIGIYLDHHINQIVPLLSQDDKWLYLLEVIGTTSGESVAIDILSSFFESYYLSEEENLQHFFNLVCSFEKAYTHVAQTFLEHMFFVLSVQSQQLGATTACIISNLHSFIIHLPVHLPRIKHSLYRDVLKGWRHLFGLVLLPISTQHLECRTQIFQILEVLLMDTEVSIQNYLAIDIVKGLLSLFFFLLEPGARKVWHEWTEADDKASVLYYEFFCHHDPNAFRYKAFISKLVNILWNRYEIWEESFGYFFELLCSQQIESRLQTSAMMSSEIFEQTNFPLHHHRDVLSVLNSFFPSTFPKLSISRHVTNADKARIMKARSDTEDIAAASTSRAASSQMQKLAPMVDDDENDDTTSRLFDKLNRPTMSHEYAAAPYPMRETVSIRRHHPAKLTQHREVVDRNANEIVALVCRSFYYNTPHRQQKMLNFSSHLVSFMRRHNVPNRDQYAKMLPKKSTFDFDMYIGKIFTKFPIFYQFLCLISTDPESFLQFGDVICSLWVNLIGEWHSTIYFEKYNNTNRDVLIERTQLFLYCLKTAQWIPKPMVFLDEMIYIMKASEITDALCRIWEHITTHLPQLDHFEDHKEGEFSVLDSTPIKVRNRSTDRSPEVDAFTRMMEHILERHMDHPAVVKRHFGRLFRFIHKEKAKRQEELKKQKSESPADDTKKEEESKKAENGSKVKSENEVGEDTKDGETKPPQEAK